MTSLAIALMTVAFLSAPSVAQAQTPYDEDRAPYEVCASCHGIDGNTAFGNFPRIAGLPKAYIAKQVRNIREGKRTNDQGLMQGAVNLLKSEDIDFVAEHFAKQTPRPPQETAPPNPAGAQLYKKGDPARAIPACNTCHDDEKSAPPLWGQRAKYLKKQFKDFQESQRRHAADDATPTLLDRLTPDDIAALVSYVSATAFPTKR